MCSFQSFDFLNLLNVILFFCGIAYWLVEILLEQVSFEKRLGQETIQTSKVPIGVTIDKIIRC